MKTEIANNSKPYQVIQHGYGSGLVSLRDWQPGDVISPITWANRKSTPSRWTVQCGDEEHADLLPEELKYINHSCEPNVFFDVEANVVRAIREIKSGEEFTFFYPSTEWDMAEPFECACATASCLKRITGASTMPVEQLERYELTGIIRRKLEGANRLSKSAAHK